MNFKKITIEKLASLIGNKFKDHHLDCVLVGGACVSIYSKNQYQSYDLDYVTFEDTNQIKRALEELGFLPKERYFCHPDCPFFIEFVTPPVSIGNEKVTKYQHLKKPLGEITLLTPTDCVKDRLASYYYWNDRQALEQALMVCRSQKEIHYSSIKKWSHQEGHQEKYAVFLKALRKT